MSTRESNESARALFGEKAPPTAGPWVKVGVVGVDAGMCWIGDPCYVLFKKNPPPEIGKDWHEFCDKTSGPATQFNYELGHAGFGVSVSTGYGDGCYDVYVRMTPPMAGASRGRVAEVKIVFIETEDPK